MMPNIFQPIYQILGLFILAAVAGFAVSVVLKKRRQRNELKEAAKLPVFVPPLVQGTVVVVDPVPAAPLPVLVVPRVESPPEPMVVELNPPSAVAAVTLPTTYPDPSLIPAIPGESLADYAIRTGPLTGFKPSMVNALLKSGYPAGCTCGEALDRFLNPEKYGPVPPPPSSELPYVQEGMPVTGSFPVGNLSHEDKVFLCAMSYPPNGKPGIHYEVLSGKLEQVRGVIQEIMLTNEISERRYDPFSYTGPLRDEVMRIVDAYKAEREANFPAGRRRKIQRK
jgi:hypothetical protein